MKLFTLGPVEMFPDTLELSGRQIPYFRTPEFSQVVLECEALLKDFAHAQPEDRAVFLTASGTGAMEATIINCLTPEDHVLIIDGGSFGHRFVQMAQLHHIPHEVITLAHGEALRAEHFKPFEEMALTALLVNIDETSTAQLYPIELISDFCQRRGMLLIVDAISSFLVDALDMSRYHMDAVIISSQKAMALAPGLSVVLLSERMLTQRVAQIESGCMYLDFKDHLKNGERGQTPFTPAVGVVLQMHQRLLAIREQGLDNVIAHCAEVARDFRSRIGALGLRLPEYPLSNACTPLIFPEGNAYEVYQALKERYGLVITPNGGALASTVVRVGHLGNHTVADNIELIEKLKIVMEG